MLPTIREILAMPVLASADTEVVAGEEHLDRPVRWIHPAEIDDIAPLLQGDELVLTTGVLLPEDDDGVRDYARSLAGAGAAGIIVELGRKWSSLPASLVTASEQEGLALIVLHREVRFAAVVEEVGARILGSEVADLRATERIHTTFVQLDVEAAGPEEILTAVVRTAGVPVVLESSRHQVVAYDAAGRSGSALLADWARRSRATFLSGRTSYDRRSGWLLTLVGSRGDHWGRLVLLTDRTPSRRDYVLVERAAAALTLHQLRSRARDSVERNAHTTLLAELRIGVVNSEVVSRCEALNFPVAGRRFVAVALRGRVDSSRDRLWSSTDLAALVVGAARALQLPVLVGIDTDHVLLLASLESATGSEDVLTALAREIRKTASVTIARGEVVESLDSSPITIVDARHVLDAGDPDDPRPWITLDDVHLRGLLHLLRDDARLHTYIRRELGPLLAHDARKSSELVRVLTVYLNTQGGKAAAAKELLLSRPVLYERLAKIEAILGVDLEDPHIRTSLHVAVLARSIAGDAASGRTRQSDEP